MTAFEINGPSLFIRLEKAPHLPILHTLIVKVNVLLGLWKIGGFGGLWEIPTKIVLKHTDNVTLSETILTVANAKWDKDGAAHFDIVVTANKAGLASIEADMNLFICNPKTCKREWFRMTRTIVVKP